MWVTINFWFWCLFSFSYSKKVWLAVSCSRMENLAISVILCQFISELFHYLFFSLSKDAQSLLKERAGYLRSRHSQFILPFSYWPEIKMRTGNSIYEVRSYTLKPGTMIEWGNNWARAINFRRENEEAFAGFFSQVGRLYQVHHFWSKWFIFSDALPHEKRRLFLRPSRQKY